MDSEEREWGEFYVGCPGVRAGRPRAAYPWGGLLAVSGLGRGCQGEQLVSAYICIDTPLLWGEPWVHGEGRM